MIGVGGYLCLDIFPGFRPDALSFRPGMLYEVGPARFSVGGAVGNTGGALARLGERVRLGGAVGDDLFGTAALDILGNFGANAETAVARIAGEHTAYAVVLSPPGSDRMFFAHRGISDRLTAESFGARFREGLSMFHFGYPPLCEGMASNGGAELRRLFAACRAEGILTSLDMSLPSPGTFSYELDWKAFLRNVLPETDLFCPSIEELEFMLRAEPGTPYPVLAETLLGMGARAVFLKLGSRGVALRTADSPETERVFGRFGAPGASWRGLDCFVAPEPVKVIGTTGAGDSAAAGLLAAIRGGGTGAEAAAAAARLAERVISSPEGIQGL